MSLVEFRPGQLPVTLDLGDEFQFEGWAYKVKATSTSGWITAQRLAELPAAPELAALEAASPSPLVGPTEPAQLAELAAQDADGRIDHAPVVGGDDERPVVDAEFASSWS